MSTFEGRVAKRRKGGAPEQQPAYQPNRCFNCINVKVKCSGGRPCARCFRLCLVCLPRCADLAGKPYIDLAIQQINIGDVNESYMKALNTFKMEGTLDRHKTIQALQAWRNMSVITRYDVSRGLHDAVCRLADISYTELESHESVTYDARPPPITPPSAEMLVARRASECEGLSQTPSFRQFDERACMLLCTVSTPAGGLCACNDVYTQWLASTAEITHYITSQRVLGIHILASLVEPDDRYRWYETTLASSHAKHPPSISFIKCRISGVPGRLCERVYVRTNAGDEPRE